MPIVEITLIEGRTDEAKEKLHKKVAEAVSDSIGAPLESIRIILREVPGAHFSAGGVAKSKPKPKS